MPTGTKIVGTLSNGWIRISSPTAYTGRYVSASVLGTSAPVNTTPLTGWAGYTKTSLLNSSGRKVGSLPAGTTVSGGLKGTHFVVGSDPYAGKRVSMYDVMWTDMTKALRGNVAKPTSKAPVGETVTRYTVKDLDYKPAVRAAATTHSTLVARMTPGTALEGQYVNGAWFKVTSGAYAGRYVSADLLHPTSVMADANGQIPSADLCEVPSWMNTAWAPKTPRTLQCNALAGLLEMNKAFKAKFGYNLVLDEGYRDLQTQNMYAKVCGFPRAAKPGTSNHGYGRAMDLLGNTSALAEGRGASPFKFGTAADRWLSNNGKAYGWDRPEHLDKNGTNPEYWHYNWIG